jgi:hypothetical protein
MKKIIGLVTILCLMIFGSGCKKDNCDGHMKIFLSGQVTSPAVSNGMLCFTDTTHFKSYYDYLDSLCEFLDDSLTDFDLDSVLYSYEVNFDNFTSLREHEYQLTEGSADPFDVLRNDFIGDDILKSILSSNYEVCVGGDVYIYFNVTDIYKIENGEASIVSSVQNYKKGSVDILFDQLQHPEVSLISTKHQYMKIAGVTGDLRIDAHYLISNVDCDPYEKVFRLWLSTPNNLDLTTWSITWEVDYGDGNVNIWYDYEKVYLYTYQSDGPFIANISWKYEDPNNSGHYISDNRDVDVFTLTCSSSGVVESSWIVNGDQTDYAISALLAYKPYLMWKRDQLFAKTIAWKWNGSQGKWKRFRADNQVAITEYDLRNEHNCTVFESGDEQKQIKKRKTRRIRVKDHFAIYNDENKSYHQVDFPNQTISDNLVLIPCP